MTLLLPVGAGCGSSTRLETGYVYQPLSGREVDRQAYYADPFSVEARRAASQARSAGPSIGP
jgi:hypothetical protein